MCLNDLFDDKHEPKHRERERGRAGNWATKVKPLLSING